MPGRRTCLILAALVLIPIAALAGSRLGTILFDPPPDPIESAAPPPGGGRFDFANLLIPRASILAGGPAKDGIPSLLDPATANWADVELIDSERIVCVTLAGATRAYPLRILVAHEVVNDTLGLIPIAVIYCPLCDSVSVVDRRIDDEVLTFGVSGLLHDSNVLLFDRASDSLWSQIDFRSVSGAWSGRRLRAVTAWSIASVEVARARFPRATVMTFDTGHRRSYQHESGPYASYFAGDTLLFPVEHSRRDLADRTRVIGVRFNDDACAVAIDSILDRVELEVGGAPITIASDCRSVHVVAAPDGAEIVHAFWFAWVTFHPHTRVHQQ